MMIKLLQETLDFLEEKGFEPKDVKWVGTSYEWMMWDDFAQRANFSYDNGYGTHEIAIGLKVVGEDWWFERWEYDGSEGWTFKRFPSLPSVNNPKMKITQDDCGTNCTQEIHNGTFGFNITFIHNPKEQ